MPHPLDMSTKDFTEYIGRMIARLSKDNKHYFFSASAIAAEIRVQNRLTDTGERRRQLRSRVRHTLDGFVYGRPFVTALLRKVEGGYALRFA